MKSKKSKLPLIFAGLLVLAACLPSGGGGSPFGGGQKLSVMMVIEPENESALPISMTSSWNSKDVEEWMQANADEPLQVVDKQRLRELAGKFADVIKSHPPERYPWMYISNGSHGAQGDPPIDKEALLKELKEWGPK